MRALAAELREKIDGICIEYHYFKNENVSPPTKIDCDILFYTKDENAIIHLGIKKDETLGYYIPKTFFVEKIGEDGVDIYIDKQEKIIATKKNRVIML